MPRSNMSTFTKHAISLDEQIHLLKERQLTIINEDRAKAFLSSVSFFRLSPYMRSFQIPGNSEHLFQPGTGFRQISQLYDFDRRLRLLIMDAIERVEVASRAMISNHMGPKYGAHWYMDVNQFKQYFKHERLLNTISDKQENDLYHYRKELERIDRLRTNEERKTLLKERRAKETYARHYPLTYDEPSLMPGWAMVEELSMGELSRIFAGIAKDLDKKAIAKAMNLVAPLLGSWLHTLTGIRNICAHHSRLWNRELGVKPELPRSQNFLWPDTLRNAQMHMRLYVVLAILNYMMKQVSPHTSWNQRLKELFNQFPDIPLNAMGMPQEWQNDPFWT